MNDIYTIPFSELVDYLDGKLSPDQVREISGRLELGDDRVKAELELAKNFLAASKYAQDAEPPARVRSTLRERFREVSSNRSPASWFQQLRALLTFDSRGRLAPAGVRGMEADGSLRQLIYNAEIVEVALNISPNPQEQRLSLTGQVFPLIDLEPGSFSVQLVSESGFGDALIVTDELGEFVFDEVLPGTYDVVLSSDAIEILLPALTLQI